MIEKAIVGTAQFGLDYGITNKAGKTSYDEVLKIIAFCKKIGIKHFDTASAYGDSQQVLANAFETLGFKDYKITAKSNSEEIALDIDKSLGLFKTLDTFLFHSPSQLIDSGLFKKNINYLEGLKKENILESIGFSVYDQQQADEALNLYPFDILQIPINLFNQQFNNESFWKKCKKSSIKIQARSIFLQGLLLDPVTWSEDKFSFAALHFKEYKNFLEEKKISPLAACLDFIFKNKQIDEVVFGINSLEQLEEISQQLEHSATYDTQVYSKLSSNDEELINPLSWLAWNN